MFAFRKKPEINVSDLLRELQDMEDAFNTLRSCFTAMKSNPESADLKRQINFELRLAKSSFQSSLHTMKSKMGVA